ncbi:SdpI family protein [Bifidobacterium longum]|uniref:SdpI family protein n=1 Tax=Bifidobacterium longum subsp. infantis TaxID=1682 RepID=A0A4S5B5R1_BIFLI|nr:SdpI family protein [Bifidobacterium longum]THJ27237.1 SdpI family protein [Bifidobacterium longum subsp. infantis]
MKRVRMLIILALILLISSYYLYTLYNESRKGNLELNYQVGIKTRWTMSSEEVWNYVHKKYSFVFLISGIIVALMAAIVIIGAFLSKSINNLNNIYWLAMLFITVLLLLFVIAIGFYANNDAKSYFLMKEEKQ